MTTPIRLRCEDRGHVSSPHVGDLTRGGVEFWHRQSHQALTMTWNDVIRQGAAVFQVTPSEFLAILRAIVLSNEPAPVSGPSARETTIVARRVTR